MTMRGEVESLQRFAELLGADGVGTDEAVRAYAVDEQTPPCVLFPTTVDELTRCTATADQAGLAVIPAGNGTQLGVGRTPRRYDVALSTRRLRRVLAHEAADMTVTVEAGLTLSELNAALAPAGQRLPLDPPHPESMTIGALIATDASGPLRLSQGKVRDLLIGITLVLADGTLVHGGGRVVKNVAGYDLMKLFTGSFGTLGIIVEATFKVRPLPEREAVLVLPAENAEGAVGVALDVLAAPVAPLYVEALNRPMARGVAARTDGPAVVVGCAGPAEEVAVQMERLVERFGACGSTLGAHVCDAAEGARLYATLRDAPMSGSRAGMFGCKLSLLPTKLGTVLSRVEDEAARCGVEVGWLAHAGSGVAFARFSATAAFDASFPPFADWLQTTVRAAGGWAVFDLLPVPWKARIDPWGIEPPGAGLMRAIKQTLDPHGGLSPGRFVGGI